MKKKLFHIGEFGLIELIRKAAGRGPGVVRGIGDDAAVLEGTKGEYLLLTTDMLAEGVHFTRSMGGRAIGHKALACNVSDIAAMGGRPTYAVVSIALPPSLELAFAQNIYAGINALAKRFGVAIVGGDTIKSSKIVINIALLGTVKKSELVLRGGARPGDIIFVTGTLGRSFQTGKHLNFTPRVLESQYLVKKLRPTAMIDISDGLATDLQHVLKASRVGAILYAVQIPLTAKATLKEALTDGEDFELLFTLPKAQAKRLQSSRHFRFYPIGQIVKPSAGLKLVDKSGQRLKMDLKGFRHF